MKKFLFVTHITPCAKRTALRRSLIDIYFRALDAQTYGNWKVAVLGEEEKTEGRFHYFFLGDLPKEEKFAEVRKIFSKPEMTALTGEADYIIKLDDDDIISPRLLQDLAEFDGDLYYDKYHTFTDVSSGMITQQRRQWIASTCVHKKEHALSAWNGPGASAVGNLLYSDHSQSWHLYYGDKKTVAADPHHPVYLRVLSPTSVSSGASAGEGNRNDIPMNGYRDYLAKFGDWTRADVKDFDAYLPLLARAWNDFSGSPQSPLPPFAKKEGGVRGRIRKWLSGLHKS
ncbi:MAG TPA: hypothetical protein VFU15_04305 [Bacteroidia bacterium]|nr:hypothetical protein [Bacteroidia bacterium]